MISWTDQQTVDFIGIGTPKAATSWLAQCLSEHPDIFVPPEKELLYFGPIKKYYLDRPQNPYTENLEWYLSQFSSKKSGQLCGEFSTWYLYYPNIAQAIYNLFPNAKLLLVLRDPVDRLFSYYRHVKAKGKHGNLSFGETVEKYPELLDQGCYHKHLSAYLEYFPANQIHVSFYDDIQAYPLSCIQSVYSFLEVDPTIEPPSLKTHSNVTSQKYTLGYTLKKKILKFTKRKPRLKKLLLDLRHSKLLKHLTPDFNLGLKVTNEKIDPDVETRLRAYYQPHNDTLGKFLKRDLTAWNTNSIYK